MKNNENSKPRSVVYSFEGRWEEPLRIGSVRVFFRKRRPVVLPEMVFFYVGVPVKQIIGFSNVERIEPTNLSQAKSARKSGAITENELIKYIGDRVAVHAIYIGEPTIFPEPFELRELENNFGFSPPQSFSNVGSDFEKALIGRVK